MSIQAAAPARLEARAGQLAELAERSFRQFDADAIRTGLEERIRKRPVAAVLAALTAGFLVGRLLR